MLCEMAGRKRKLDEWDVSEMEESEGATVHGVFTDLSLAFSSTAQPCFSSLLGVHVATLRQVDL